MRVVKLIAWMALIAFVVIQFFPADRNQSYTVPDTDFMVVNDVPVNIQQKLQVSCYDCHSNNTAYPWYNRIQPVAWYLEDHIKEGKAELNFNEWDSLSSRRKSSKLRSIIKQIESGEMPPDYYTIIHRDAEFSDLEVANVTQWITQLKDSL